MSGLHIQHKRNFHAMRWLIATVLLVVVVAYGYFGIRWYNTGELSPFPIPVAASESGVDTSTVSEKELSDHTVKNQEPRYIEMPSLGVTVTRVTKVGVTERNMLDLPTNVHDAGWYAKSAKPGSGAGAVVLSGHSGTGSAQGIFTTLDELKPGDSITIERGDGRVFTYEVHDVREKPIDWVNQSGMKEMMYSADPAREGLSLIGGSGKWIPKEKVFSHRILVRALLSE